MKRIIRMLVVCALAISMAVMSYGDSSYVPQQIDSATYEQNLSRAYCLYNDLLDYWTDSETDTVLYPDTYGGAYVNDDGNLVILVTEQDYDIFDKIISINQVAFENTSISYSRLLIEKEKVVQAMLDPTNDLYGVLNAVGAVSHKRSVIVYIEDNGITTYSNDDEVADTIKDITGCECNIIIERGSDRPTLCNNNVLDSNSIVYPGYKIDVNYNGYVSYRSIAFWAYDRYGNLGVVTAPHSTLQVGMPMSYYGKDFGSCTQAVFGGNVDAAFIKMENSGFTPSTFFTGPGFDLNGNYYIDDFASNGPERYPIYTIGARSGPQTGYVISGSVTTAYGITDCVVASNYADKGDSGGLAVIKVNGQYLIAGIITGKTASNTVGFTKAKHAIQTLGLTVYH